MEPQKNKDSVQNRRVRTLLVYLFLHIIRRPQADTYAVGVQREEPCVLEGLLMFISG